MRLYENKAMNTTCIVEVSSTKPAADAVATATGSGAFKTVASLSALAAAYVMSTF